MKILTLLMLCSSLALAEAPPDTVRLHHTAAAIDNALSGDNYNVKNYLAYADSTHASATTIAIQAAVDATPIGSTVVFSAGKFLVSSPITIDKAITVVLNGASLSGATSSLLHVRVSGVMIKGDGSSTIHQYLHVGSGIKIDSNLTDINISGVNFLNPGTTFKIAADSGYDRINGCGVLALGSYIHPCARIVVDHCSFVGQYVGIQFYCADDSKVLNSTFNWVHDGWMQVNVYSSRRFVIQGNTFIASGLNANAIECLGNTQTRLSEYGTIGPNTIYGNYSYEGINLLNTSHTSVTANTITMTNADSTAVCAIALADAGYWNTTSSATGNEIIANPIYSAGKGNAINLIDNGATYHIGADGNTVAYNSITNVGTGSSIAVGSYCDNNNVVHNTINGAGIDGVYVGTNTGTSVVENRINNVTRYGIYLNPGNYADVLSNILRKTTSTAIVIGGATRQRIERNWMDSCTYSVYVAGGTPSIAQSGNILTGGTPAMNWATASFIGSSITSFGDTVRFPHRVVFGPGITNNATFNTDIVVAHDTAEHKPATITFQQTYRRAWRMGMPLGNSVNVEHFRIGSEDDSLNSFAFDIDNYGNITMPYNVTVGSINGGGVQYVDTTRFAANTDSTYHITVYKDTMRLVAAPPGSGVGLSASDSVSMRNYSNSIYQAKGTYATAADTLTLLTYIQSLLAGKQATIAAGTYTTPADTTTLLTYIQSLLAGKQATIAAGTYATPTDTLTLLTYLQSLLAGKQATIAAGTYATPADTTTLLTYLQSLLGATQLTDSTSRNYQLGLKVAKSDIYTLGSPLALDSSIIVLGRVLPWTVGNNETIDSIKAVTSGAATNFTYNFYTGTTVGTPTDSLLTNVWANTTVNGVVAKVATDMRLSGSLGQGKIWWFRVTAITSKPDAVSFTFKVHRP